MSDPFWEGFVGDGEFKKYQSQISGQLFLRQNRRYFVEALHKQSTSGDHLLVAWKIPRVGNFSHITRGRISQYIHPHELHNLDVTRYARHIPLTPAVLQKPLIPQKLKDKISINNKNSEASSSSDAFLYRREDYPRAREHTDRYPVSNSNERKVTATGREGPSATSDTKQTQVVKDTRENLKDFVFGSKLHQSIAHKMFPICDYNPSYRVDFKVARYEGVYLIHETAVFPDDKTHLKHVEYYKPCYEMRAMDSHGVALPDVSEFGEKQTETWNVKTQEVLSTRDSSEISENDGNVTTVTYTDLRHRRLKSIFSTGRKILAALNLSRMRSEDETLYTSKQRKVNKLSQGKQILEKEKKEKSSPAFETWEEFQESIKGRGVKNRQNVADNGQNQVRIIGLKDETGKDFPVIKQSNNKKKGKVWHRKKHKTEAAAESIFVDNTSPLVATWRKLKTTGEWEEIVAYAKRKGLLLTKKTWMYVTWKFLRYEKPKKPHDKLVEFVYKQNPPKCRTDGNILLNEKVCYS